MTKMRWLARTALLAALLTVAGTLKLPSLAPGAEFQFSAPLAVAMCAVFGFKQYILAGLLSSVMGLLLGTQTLLNVTVALVFRMVAGGIVALGGQSWPILAIAGPLGSIMARLVGVAASFNCRAGNGFYGGNGQAVGSGAAANKIKYRKEDDTCCTALECGRHRAALMKLAAGIFQGLNVWF